MELSIKEEYIKNLEAEVDFLRYELDRQYNENLRLLKQLDELKTKLKKENKK